MKLKDIYEEFLNGKKIRRKSWKEGSWININNITVLGKESLTAEDWEIVEEKKKKKQWWEPEIRGNYYYISGTGHISCNPYDDDDIDKRFLSLGNCFQTEEQAEFMVEKLKVIHELEKFVFENNTEEIDWSDVNQEKLYLGMNFKNKSIDIFHTYCWIYIPFNVVFTSEEIARRAIETIGEDRIKKYYFGVEDE